MLESYKVDARGNIQFQNGKPEARRAFKTLPLDEPLSRHSVNGKKVKNPKVINQIEERRKQIMKDVQQMTLYQGADLTPDTEGGPRRMYQKTEIQEGDKRIEILEIVECVDTTPDSSPAKRLYKTPKSIRTPRLTPRSNRSSRLLAASTPKDKDLKVPSKIPVNSKSGKSSQRLSRSASRESSPNLNATGTNPNKDKAIADLLIEALNNNEGSTVEFVPSPKDYLKPPTVKRNVPRKTNQSGTRRSAHSGKYLTQFEVIPEERSGLSFDSSAEDSRAGSQQRATTKQSQQQQLRPSHSPRRQSNNLSELSETSSSSPKSSKSAASSVSVKQETQKPVSNSPTSESSKRSSPPSVKEAPLNEFKNRTNPDSRSKSDSDRSENSRTEHRLESNGHNINGATEHGSGSSESRSETSSVKSVKYVQPPSSQQQQQHHHVNNSSNDNKKSDTQKHVTSHNHSVGSNNTKQHDPVGNTTTSTSNSTTNQSQNSSNNNQNTLNTNGSKSRRSSFQVMENASVMDALNGNVTESSKVVTENNNKKQLSPPAAHKPRAVIKSELPNNQKPWAEYSKQQMGSPLDSANEGICRHHLICVNL